MANDATNTAGEPGFNLVELYTGKNKAPDGYRLAVASFKSDTSKTKKTLIDDDGKKVDNPDFDPAYKKPDARCVSIPTLKIECTPQILKDALQQAFEDMQDAVVRKLIVDGLEARKGVINIHDDDVGFEAIAAFAAANAAGGKIKKEGIEDWFDTDVADMLTVSIANAMKLPDNPEPAAEARLAAAVTNYKTVFMSLAAPRSDMSKKVAGQCLKALETCENKESRMYKAIKTKLDTLLTKQEVSLELL